MFSSATSALAQMFDRKFQGVLWLGVAGTIGLFFALWLGLWWAVTYVPDFDLSWLHDVLRIVSTFLVFVAFILMGAPVAQMFASIFVDRVAAAVEAKHYPQVKQGGGATVGELLAAGLSFTAVSIVLNLMALPLQIASLGHRLGGSAVRQRLFDGANVFRAGSVAPHDWARGEVLAAPASRPAVCGRRIDFVADDDSVR